MADSLLFLAFSMGIVSACSLPLGTLTTLLWRPDDRSVGILMAFGGGALLAALTIDLVGSALAKGEFYWLAVGCVIGGALFVGLDNIVNSRGGFLRKSSTVVHYLRRQRRQRFKKALGDLERIDAFRDLPQEDIEDLASAAIHGIFEKGATIYSAGDPSDFFYVVEKGEVSVTDPRTQRHSPTVYKGRATPGQHAFITGSPHTHHAVATEAVPHLDAAARGVSPDTGHFGRSRRLHHRNRRRRHRHRLSEGPPWSDSRADRRVAHERPGGPERRDHPQRGHHRTPPRRVRAALRWNPPSAHLPRPVAAGSARRGRPAVLRALRTRRHDLPPRRDGGPFLCRRDRSGCLAAAGGPAQSPRDGRTRGSLRGEVLHHQCAPGPERHRHRRHRSLGPAQVRLRCVDAALPRASRAGQGLSRRRGGQGLPEHSPGSRPHRAWSAGSSRPRATWTAAG